MIPVDDQSGESRIAKLTSLFDSTDNGMKEQIIIDQSLHSNPTIS
jgi:hypothetical protein